MFHANVWMLDNTVIKARLAPFGEQIRHHHEFVFEDDDLSILGNALPETLRDSQLSLCETVRAALDNASVIGPMAELNTDLLVPGQDLSIKKHKTWFREGEGAIAGYPAVRDITINSHLPELLQLVDLFLGFADKESGLPPPALGDTGQGGSEALRTVRNASMFLGAAALPVRDTVRNFDTFTVSVISADVAWNKKYDANPTRDGDHDVIARGSTSLIAKEVLAQSLAEFRATVTEDEMPHLKSRALLVQRAKANDIPVDDVLEDEEIAKQTIAAQQEMQQRQLMVNEELVKAQVAEMLTRAFEHVAKAQAEKAGVDIEVANAVVESFAAGHKAVNDAEKNQIAARKPQGGKNVGNK